jgi:hypothetical protein
MFMPHDEHTLNFLEYRAYEKIAKHEVFHRKRARDED